MDELEQNIDEAFNRGKFSSKSAREILNLIDERKDILKHLWFTYWNNMNTSFYEIKLQKIEEKIIKKLN